MSATEKGEQALKRTSWIQGRVIPQAANKLEVLATRYGVPKAQILEMLLIRSPIFLPCEHLKSARCSITCAKRGTVYPEECENCSYKCLRWW